jgi:hypothetical protein
VDRIARRWKDSRIISKGGKHKHCSLGLEEHT